MMLVCTVVTHHDTAAHLIEELRLRIAHQDKLILGIEWTPEGVRGKIIVFFCDDDATRARKATDRYLAFVESTPLTKASHFRPVALGKVPTPEAINEATIIDLANRVTTFPHTLL